MSELLPGLVTQCPCSPAVIDHGACHCFTCHAHERHCRQRAEAFNATNILLATCFHTLNDQNAFEVTLARYNFGWHLVPRRHQHWGATQDSSSQATGIAYLTLFTAALVLLVDFRAVALLQLPMDLLPHLRTQVARCLDDFVLVSDNGQEVPDEPDKWTRLHWWKVFQHLVSL